MATKRYKYTIGYSMYVSLCKINTLYNSNLEFYLEEVIYNKNDMTVDLIYTKYGISRYEEYGNGSLNGFFKMLKDNIEKEDKK